MPTQYNGIAANITTPGPISITSYANTTPIAVTTTSPHGMTTGDTVLIRNAPIFGASGKWAVTVTGASTFTLNGSIAGGASSAVGSTAIPLTLGATYAIPSDGDSRAAASVDVAFSALGDRTAYLEQNAPTYYLAELYVVQNNDDTFGSWAASASTTGSGWIAMTGASVPWTVPVVIGDIVEISLSASIQMSAGGPGNGYVSLFSAQGVPGGSFTPAKIPGSSLAIPVLASGSAMLPVSLRGSIQTAGTGSVLNIYPYMRAAVSGFQATAFGDYTLTAQVWRATGITQ